MTSRVEKTEQTLRREERALDEGRLVEVWREVGVWGRSLRRGTGLRVEF